MPAPRHPLPPRVCGCSAVSRRHHGFTLIELLTVIAIVAVLAGITFGVVSGVRERARIGQARTELAALGAALEAYKRQYGDYPWTEGNGSSAGPAITSPVTVSSNEGRLFNALVGRIGPKNEVPIRGRSVVDLGRFRLESSAPNDLPDPATSDSKPNAFVDSWGNRYLYFYKNEDDAADWTAASYVLLSAGPDGLLVPPQDSGADPTTGSVERNVDNIYSNR